MPAPGYIAYIDEAGDHGLKRIRTANAPGASEWFVLSAFVVRAELEPEVVEWTRRLLANVGQHQLRYLHFRTLPEHKKPIVCHYVGHLRARIFTFISHKKNMENYRNFNAERAKVNRTAWFYVWCTKLLMESVTDFCGRDSRQRYGEPRVVRFEFAETGGVKLEDVRLYYKYIKEQAALGLSYRNDFPLDWAVVDQTQMEVFQSATRAGLQLADVAASAFYAGVELEGGVTKPQFAKHFLPIVARDVRGQRSMYGLKVLPRSITPRLSAAQSDLLRFYLTK